MYKLKTIEKSDNSERLVGYDKPEKKLQAVFENIKTKREKKVHFGQAGASDYTKHKNKERKENYIDRHKKRENWNDPTTPGALSRYILWNKPTLKESVKDYKEKFFSKKKFFSKSK